MSKAYKSPTSLDTQQKLGMQNGVVIAVPIPEEYEAAGEDIQKLVKQAVQESEANGVSTSGKDATPWLLSRVAELSHGKSLVSNVALLRNTALIGEHNEFSHHLFPHLSVRWENCCRVPQSCERGGRSFSSALKKLVDPDGSPCFSSTTLQYLCPNKLCLPSQRCKHYRKPLNLTKSFV